jgi:hypothetical protein
MPAGPNTRGVSGITLNQFFTAVLQGLGAPVTANNLAKLGAVAAKEGHGGSYNPFNYVVPPGPGKANDHPFNSVGVQNYTDAATGVAMTIKLLSGNRPTLQAAKANLMSDGAYNGFTNAFSQYYTSWGGSPLTTSYNAATQKLGGILDGPPVSGGAGSLGGGATSATAGGALPTAPAYNFDTGAWSSAHEGAFNAWMKTQDPATQQQIISELQANNAPNSLPQIAATQNKYGSNVKDFYGYLAQLPADQRNGVLGNLSVQQPQAPASVAPPDPAASAQMTSLLSRFGVSYSNAPQPTPALLAFLNGLGMNIDSAQAVRDRAVERIGAATSDSMAEIDTAAGRTKQNITADLIRRGVLSSGESNTRYARQAEDVGLARANVQKTDAANRETNDTTLQQAKDLARQQALDKVLGAEQDQATAAATSKAQTDALTQQQQQSDLSWSREQAARLDELKATTSATLNAAQQGVAV